jgi:hypothetical protein
MNESTGWITGRGAKSVERESEFRRFVAHASSIALSNSTADALVFKAADAAEDAGNSSITEDAASIDPKMDSYAPKRSVTDPATPEDCRAAASASSNTLALE